MAGHLDATRQKIDRQDVHVHSSGSSNDARRRKWNRLEAGDAGRAVYRYLVLGPGIILCAKALRDATPKAATPYRSRHVLV